MTDEQKAGIKNIVFECLPCSTNKTCKEVDEVKRDTQTVKDKQDTQTKLLIGLLVSIIATLVAVVIK